MDKFLIEHFRFMAIGFKAERQRSGLFPAFCGYRMAALALVLPYRLV